ALESVIGADGQKAASQHRKIFSGFQQLFEVLILASLDQFECVPTSGRQVTTGFGSDQGVMCAPDAIDGIFYRTESGQQDHREHERMWH
ncbi:MAG: hypothetical protein ABGX29_03185, partial [Candidatus Poseidoniia archaeon]